MCSAVISSSDRKAVASPIGKPAFSLALLSPFVLLIHGYHPLADDGAVYVAGIKKLAYPALYPRDAVFALSPTRLSVFAHLLAACVRWLHLPLPPLLLFCHLLSIYLFLLGCWKVTSGLSPRAVENKSTGSIHHNLGCPISHDGFPSGDVGIHSSPAEIFLSDSRSLPSSPDLRTNEVERLGVKNSEWAAVLLAACCFTLPIAGTSLDIMDPYVTARSFSTPLGLFALAAVLEKSYLRSACWLTAAALFHPLMAAYTAILLVSVALAQKARWRLLIGFYASGWTLAGLSFLLTRHAGAQTPYALAALSRSYFFLSSWQWYEYPGLVIPLLLLAATAVRMRSANPARGLAIAVTGLGTCALLSSLCFVHRGGSLWLARLQVLRAFQWVYLAGVLLAGGLLGFFAQRARRTVAAVYTLIALSLFAGQRLTYPASGQVEWPGQLPVNPWAQAFLWIRDHTPNQTLFALDNDYVEIPGEDAQGFRATAERSAVADYYKDGGIASNFPAAADLWWQGAQATAHLNGLSDAARLARLTPLGVTWIVLPLPASTHLPCPYTNAAVRVCRLGIFIHGAEGAK